METRSHGDSLTTNHANSTKGEGRGFARRGWRKSRRTITSNPSGIFSCGSRGWERNGCACPKLSTVSLEKLALV